MYSIKEKIKYHNDLKADQHLPADIELLKQYAPTHDHIRRYNAGSRITDDEVLYELLNHVTAENIRAHRRQFTEEKKEKAPKKAAAPKAAKPKTTKAKTANVASEAKEIAKEANENAAEAVDTANEALNTAKEALETKKK